jgi:hypothetical protein
LAQLMVDNPQFKLRASSGQIIIMEQDRVLITIYRVKLTLMTWQAHKIMLMRSLRNLDLTSKDPNQDKEM